MTVIVHIFWIKHKKKSLDSQNRPIRRRLSFRQTSPYNDVSSMSSAIGTQLPLSIDSPVQKLSLTINQNNYIAYNDLPLNKIGFVSAEIVSPFTVSINSNGNVAAFGIAYGTSHTLNTTGARSNSLVSFSITNKSSSTVTFPAGLKTSTAFISFYTTNDFINNYTYFTTQLGTSKTSVMNSNQALSGGLYIGPTNNVSIIKTCGAIKVTFWIFE